MDGAKRHINRDEFVWLGKNLSQDIKNTGTSYDIVLNIMNGGTHLTDYLLRNLENQINKKTTQVYNIACDAGYAGENVINDPKFYHLPPAEAMVDKKILIIEDLIDTGRSLNLLITTLSSIIDTTKIDIAVLFIKSGNTFHADGVGKVFSAEKDINPKQWIQFYYEDEE